MPSGIRISPGPKCPIRYKGSAIGQIPVFAFPSLNFSPAGIDTLEVAKLFFHRGGGWSPVLAWVGSIALLAVIGVASGVLGDRAPSHPPGVLIPEEPRQTMLQGTPLQAAALQGTAPWQHGEYTIHPVARYEVRARVVRTRSYWFGREAALSPLDFLLAWGVASDQRVQDAIRTSLSARYYRWYPRGPLPVDSGSISESMANTHLIPASKSIERALEGVRPGMLVEISGFLVNVRAKDGWKWNSSRVRHDAGPGACELMWVEAVYQL